ncbi:hypothetical protein IFM89_022494 [Coptis chinensis]|uniref:Uncharacterized protein n=1 Tax=Coptis chinensis TaxID=261450 RepID=A0A835M3P1_9MAGN|nr:hypothetical protein IFM89_022494 [Coptis chinensis]
MLVISETPPHEKEFSEWEGDGSDVAESELNREEVERIKARLEELEASRQTKGKYLKAVRLAEMIKQEKQGRKLQECL